MILFKFNKQSDCKSLNVIYKNYLKINLNEFNFSEVFLPYLYESVQQIKVNFLIIPKEILKNLLLVLFKRFMFNNS